MCKIDLALFRTTFLLISRSNLQPLRALFLSYCKIIIHIVQLILMEGIVLWGVEGVLFAITNAGKNCKTGWSVKLSLGGIYNGRTKSCKS